MSNNIEQIFDNAMVELALDFPVYARLIAKVGVKFVNDESRRFLAWTDGSSITINEFMVNEFNEKGVLKDTDGNEYKCVITKFEMMFLLAHELMHLIGLTFDRGELLGLSRYSSHDSKEKRKMELWNMATDYEINALLHTNELTDGMGNAQRKPVGKMPEWVLFEEKWMSTDAETIYYELLDKEKEGNASEADPTFDEDGDNGSQFGTGNIPGFDFGLDDHLPILDDATRSEVVGKMGEVFGSTSNGTGSSAFDRMLKNAFKPMPFNWKRALVKYIRGWIKSNYTWNKPARSGISRGLILPSAGTSPKMHIGVAVDTSGSISENELQTMMNHLFTILSQFKDFTVDVWCCGSVVYEETFKRYTAANKRELLDFEFKSDGGNDMRENFKFIKKKYRHEKLDTFICMSDFYDPLDGDTETTSPCPCIWMVIDHPNFVPPTKIKAETYPFVADIHKNG